MKNHANQIQIGVLLIAFRQPQNMPKISIMPLLEIFIPICADAFSGRMEIIMYFLKTKVSFDSAHFLYGYEGKCSNIHGHSWIVEVTVKNAFLQRNGQQKGMIMDFSDLKKSLQLIADHYDHALIYEKNTLKTDTMECLKRDGFRLIEMPFRPTAENLARHFFTILKERGFRPHNVAVYETPNNCAMYEEG